MSETTKGQVQSFLRKRVRVSHLAYADTPDVLRFDEVFATGVDVDIERMSNNCIWFSLSRGGKRVTFTLNTKRAHIDAGPFEED